jgi:thioredoxin-related protein
VQWRWDYEEAEREAREQNRHLVVFYKWWLDSHSNRMKSEVFSDPEVASRLKATINLELDRDVPQFQEYVEKFRATSVPTIIVAAPDGTYQMRSGFVPKDRLLSFLENATAPRQGGARPPPPSW